LENPFRSYEVSSAIWDHTVVAANRQVNALHNNLSQTARNSIYLPWRNKGWVDLDVG